MMDIAKMVRCVTSVLSFAVLVACGSDPPEGGSERDAGAEFRNACGGDAPLAFLGRAASPADPCGACGTGALVCAGPAMLVCLGSRDASCPEGGTNACGGQARLLLDGVPAAPGERCGPCGDGTTICAAPELLSCIAASDASACRDGASSADATRDADSVDTGRDADSVDTGRDADSMDTGRDAQGSDGSGADSERDVASSDTTVGSSDVAQPNACGGMGPLLWRGVPSAPDARCGACSSRLRCGSPTRLICSGPGPTTTCPDAGPNDTCDIPISAYTASAPTLPSPPSEPPPTATTATAITLAVSSLVYNPFDFRIYASVGSQQGSNGNSIAVIDPYAGTIVKTIFVGSEPTKMALSDDGQSLWVALDGAASVRQVDLVAGAAGQQFSLGYDPRYGAWYYPRNVAVLPGTHDAVIVTRYSKSSSADDGLVVYDNGVPRPYSAGYGLYTAEGIIATYSPSLVFGYRSALSTACVNANGVFMKQEMAVAVTQARFSFTQNVIYTGTGAAYDIASGTTLGTYAGRGPVAADASKRRVYFLSDTNVSTVSAYDMDTFLALGSETLSLGTSWFGDNFVLWGRYGYAFRAGGEIIIARSLLAAP